MIICFPSVLSPNSSASAGAFLLAGATVIAGLAIAASDARAADADLVVKFDQSRIVKLSRQIGEVIIGNPSIADIQVHSTNTLVVTGKSFGVTNIIVLDSDRNVISDQRVMVQRDEYKILNVTLGMNRRTWNCAPQCNPTVTVGDDPAFFSQNKSAVGAAPGGDSNAGGN